MNFLARFTVSPRSVGFFGIIAFHDRDVVGDVLLSFRPSIMGEAIKLGFVLSVAVSFPLVIFPCRLSINRLVFLWGMTTTTTTTTTTL